MYGDDWQNNYLINPSAMLSSRDLKDGRLPNNPSEIVVEGVGDASVGDVLKMGLVNIWSNRADPGDISTEYTIVGITKNLNPNSHEGRIYFHEDFITSNEVIAASYIGSGWNSGYQETNLIGEYDGNRAYLYFPSQNIIIDEALNDNEMKFGNATMMDLYWSIYDEEYEDYDQAEIDVIDFDLLLSTRFYNDEITIEIVGLLTDPMVDEYYAAVSMNTATYNLLIPSEAYQISLLVDDTYDANYVLDELEELGYNSIYPSSIGNQIDELFALLTSIYFGFMMILLIVLRNVQNSKKKDYLIFRSIGASKKDLNKITIIELFFTVILAYVVTLLLLVVNEMFDTFIPQYLKFFTVKSYLIIFLMLTILSLLLGNRFNKKIFSTSVITSLKQE